MKKFLLFISIFIFGHLLYAIQTGRFYIQVNNNGITSNVFFYVPEDYDSTKVYPLLWGWHGAGMPGSDMVNLLNRMQNGIKGIIVCPDANNTTTGDQINFLVNYSYNYPRQYYKIDTTKVVVTGYSWGGNMCYQLGLLNPNLVKGIIGIAPAIGAGQMVQQMWDNIKNIRMATILGSLDFNYTAVSGLMTDIKNRGGSLLYLEKPGLDHQGTNGYFGRQEFIDDYMQCYNYVLNLPSDVKTGNPAEKEFELSVYPNPSTDYLSISFSVSVQTITSIIITNSLGSEIKRFEYNELIGINSINFSTEALTSGIYYCTLNHGLNKITKSFVVLR